MAENENTANHPVVESHPKENAFTTRLRTGVQYLLTACDLTTTSIKQLRLGLEHHLGYKAGGIEDNQILKDLVDRIIQEEVQAVTDVDALPMPYGGTEYQGAIDHASFQRGASVKLVVKKKVAYDSDKGTGEWAGLLTLDKDTSSSKIELTRIPKTQGVWKMRISSEKICMDGTVVKGKLGNHAGSVAGPVRYEGADGRFSLYPLDPRPPDAQDPDKPQKPEKDPNAPKKPVGGAFGIFKTERQSDIKEQIMKETGKKVSFCQVSKVVGEQWKALSEMERGDYQRKYEDAMKKYEADVKAYEKKKIADAKKAAAQKAREEKKAAQKEEMNAKRAALGLPPLKERVVKKAKTNESTENMEGAGVIANDEMAPQEKTPSPKTSPKKRKLTEEEIAQLKKEAQQKKREIAHMIARKKFGEYLDPEIIGPEVESPTKPKQARKEKDTVVNQEEYEDID